MSRPHRFHLVLGTGPLGRAVMRLLVERQETVRMVNRSGRAEAIPDLVDVVAADLTDPEEVRKLGVGARAVYGCVGAPYHRWPEMLPPLVQGVMEVASTADGPLVYADSLHMYGPADRALHEAMSPRPPDPAGRVRARCAERVLEAHGSGRIRAVIGRGSDAYGPWVRESAVGERVFGAALDGRPADVLGNPDMPHTFTYVDDFARALVTLGEREGSWGEVWHVPSAEPVTTRQFVRMVYQQVNRTPRLRVVPPWKVAIMGWLRPRVRERKELMFRWEAPFVVDHGKYDEAFGAHPTPHREAITETLRWYRSRRAGDAAAEQEPEGRPADAGAARS